MSSCRMTLRGLVLRMRGCARWWTRRSRCCGRSGCRPGSAPPARAAGSRSWSVAWAWTAAARGRRPRRSGSGRKEVRRARQGVRACAQQGPEARRAARSPRVRTGAGSGSGREEGCAAAGGVWLVPARWATSVGYIGELHNAATLRLMPGSLPCQASSRWGRLGSTLSAMVTRSASQVAFRSASPAAPRIEGR
jgi:hypothetical protein